ncbi:MAG: manganese efflux pump MntP family protein [Candidatus Limivicinus sp.]|nr:manganese efflux pump MntP family protein [Candidatus Limivicinus sp.]
MSMGFIELLLIAVGLSMDAFAVSVCKGLSVKKVGVKHAALAGLYFGGFQFLMPVIGYLLGFRFESVIESIDHWVAFVLLAFIGGNMIKESFGKAEELNDDFGVKTMLLMAIATSIDALAVGITFAFLEVQILPAAGLIGVTTFLLSFVGIYIGNAFGTRYKSRAELAGGIILVVIGVKILLEHLGIISL